MRNTLIGDIASAGEQAQYDGYAKSILSNRYILAWIMKETIEEYRELSIQQIAVECIEAESQGKIIGDNTESVIPGEGKVIYDVRFRAYTPQGKGRQKLLFNVEAQKQFYPGYEIVTRGIFYGARMISTQVNTEFTLSDYNGIKKVYSIWICMNAPDKIGNAVSKFMITKSDIKEGIPDEPGSYDKLTVVQIALGRKISDDKGSIVRLLNVVFSVVMPFGEKEKILAEEFGIRQSDFQREELNAMCNLGEGIFEKGVEFGEEKGIEQGIRQGQRRMLTLIQEMMKSGDGNSVFNLTDSAFLERMYQKYQL